MRTCFISILQCFFQFFFPGLELLFSLELYQFFFLFFKIEYNCKGLLWPADFFIWPRIFKWIEHNILPALIALCFYLSAPNLHKSVLCLISNALKNRQIDFLALNYFTVTYFLGDIWLLLVNPSGMETIAASVIALYCCWSLHLPAVLYKLLMLSIHICSFITLLLNDWSNPMVTFCCLISSDCNNPLTMAHFLIKWFNLRN